jgi:hypothetical protein
LVHAPKELVEATQHYVCVRITDMQNVDVRAMRFDFDLTMAIVLMNADGTIYHRYGTRDGKDPLSWTSIASFSALLQQTLNDHQDYERAPTPPLPHEPMRAIDLPPLAKKIAQGQRLDCVHCHTINDSEYAWAQKEGRYQADDRWLYPEPARIGITMNATDQSLLSRVADSSAAADAGLQAGDRVTQLGVQPRVRTIADLQWALHNTSAATTSVQITFARGDVAMTATLKLKAGWKHCSFADYAWRPYKWNLSPSLGCGGTRLTAEELRAIGEAPSAFAWKVSYFADWGERAARGTAPLKAGIQKGDVVLAIDGQRDFASVDEVHAFVALKKQSGEVLELQLLRGKQRITAKLLLPE